MTEQTVDSPLVPTLSRSFDRDGNRIEVVRSMSCRREGLELDYLTKWLRISFVVN